MNKILFFIFLLPMMIYANPQETDLKLVGKGTLSYIFWDIYEVSYFKGEKGVEVLELHYLRDVEKKYSVKGWKEGLRPLKGFEEQVNWLVNIATDIKKGDKLRLYKYGEKHILITMNGKTLRQKENDLKLYQALHYPWIGKNPVDEDLKEELIGT